MEECSVLIYPLIMSSSIYYGTRPHRCNNAPKIKKWCQNGVKSRKSDDYKEEKVLQTP